MQRLRCLPLMQMQGRIFGRQGNGPVKIDQGVAGPVKLQIDQAALVQDGHLIRFQCDGSRQVCNSLRVVFLSQAQPAAIKPGGGHIWLAGHGLAQIGKRGVHLALRDQHLAAQVKGLRVGRFERNDAIEICKRLIRSSQAGQDRAAMAISLGQLGIKHQGAGVVDERFGCTAVLLVKAATPAISRGCGRLQFQGAVGKSASASAGRPRF